MEGGGGGWVGISRGLIVGCFFLQVDGPMTGGGGGIGRGWT